MLNRRKVYFIERKFQSRFIIRFCILVILGSILTVVLLYLLASRTTTVSFENTKAVVKSTADFIFPILIQTVIVVTILMAIFTIMLTLVISHKIAGPLYRVKKELNMIEGGELGSDFKIREKDQLQEVAEALNKMKTRLREKIFQIKNCLQELRELISGLESSPEVKSQLETKLKEINEKLDYFSP